MSQTANGTATSMMESSSHQNVSNAHGGSEYSYILIVMLFYGIFLLGIMFGYMRSKRKDKNANLLLLYEDEKMEWRVKRKSLPSISGLKSMQKPLVFSALQGSRIQALSCAMCSMEGNSNGSESSFPDIHLTIHEEESDSEHGDGSVILLHEISESSEESSEKLNQLIS
ncbi:potassium voltage-gated channel subfamily E member 4 [Protopterus annectens]|uniref:potassium voltage-gated channel subfamily E member 4 n=1 Tax=Protopterus annectens TaxID=7888 RepID=UPI001CFBBD8C|nr:potassium voltage-gated channel subfamily E member 4 [Protopterus annectens]